MEYAVIRWYNDNKALVLFTGWGAFFMHTGTQRKYVIKEASFPC